MQGIDQFYTDILPEGCHVVGTSESGQKPKHYVVESTEALIQALSKHPDKNTYHSLGAYDDIPSGRRIALAEDFLKDGELVQAALPRCPRAKAFGFDLDVGEANGKYNTLDEAGAALEAAIREGHIPEPRWVVFSGGGLQFYLVLGGNECLSEELWTTQFQKLRSHIRKHLKTDPTVGTLPYRLLRSPLTPNHKYSPPTMPMIVNEEPGPYLDEEWLAGLSSPEPAKQSRETSNLEVTDRLPIKDIGRACAAIQHEIDTAGADTPEPVWAAVANVAAHTFETRMAFHDMSRGYPGYDEAEANAKYDHIVRNTSAGPWGCENFGNASDPESPCHGCWAAKRRNITNPIQATRVFLRDGNTVKKTLAPAQTEKPTASNPLDDIVSGEPDYDNTGVPLEYFDPDLLPSGFDTDNVTVFNKKGAVCQVFYVRGFQGTPGLNRNYVAFSLDARKWHYMPAKDISSPQKCAGHMLEAGIEVNQPAAATQVFSHMAYRSRFLQAVKFGWNKTHNAIMLPTGSVGGETTYPDPTLDTLSTKWGSTKGSMDKWLDAIQIYGRDGQEPYLMAVLASLASPLLNYFDLEKGVIYSLAGPGGTGKTSALCTATSVWGRPLETLASMSSTYNAIRHVMSYCGHLPMVVDDMTQASPEVVKNLALEISQGEGKGRLTQDLQLAESGTWQLVYLTSTNISLHTKLAELADQGSADMNRLIEVGVLPSEEVSVIEAKAMLDALEENHGHMGPAVYSQLLTRKKSALVKKMRKLRDMLTIRDGLQGKDRFIRDLIIVCYFAHTFAKEVDDRFPGEPDEMLTWMRTRLLYNNRYIESVLDARVPSLDDFLMEYAVERLVLTPKADKSYAEEGLSQKGYIYVRGTDIVVPTEVLRAWCRRQQLSPRTVTEKWAATGKLHNFAKADGDQNRWSGRLAYPMKVGSKVFNPTVMVIKHDGSISAGEYSDTGEAEAPRVSVAAHGQ